MAGEYELEPSLAKALDEIDDLATGMSHDVANASGTEAVADHASDGSDALRIGWRQSES
jgi:hypothetical protein